MSSNLSASCAFVLDNNQPCRGPALHNDRYCRHHTPDALNRRRLRSTQLNGLDELPADLPDRSENGVWTPNVLRAYWRMHHRVILSADSTDCDEIFEMVLGALGNHDISHRSAGSLLRAVLDRRKVLAAQAQQAAFRDLEEKVRQHRALVSQAHSPTAVPAADLAARRSNADQSVLEALRTAMFPTAAPQRPAPHPFCRL